MDSKVSDNMTEAALPFLFCCFEWVCLWALSKGTGLSLANEETGRFQHLPMF